MSDSSVVKFSRVAELVGFGFGLFIILGDKGIEWSCRYRDGLECGGFAFDTFAYATLLIAPFTLGRATAGKVWEAIPGLASSAVSKVFRRQTQVLKKPPEPPANG